MCATGVPVCGEEPACQPIQTASQVDYCGDKADNDCNGAVDDACVTDPGEACTNALDKLGLGGTFEGSLSDAADDAVSRCGGTGVELFYRLDVPREGALLKFRPRYEPGVRYVLYRDCTLEPVSCRLDGDMVLEGGSYILAVEAEGESDPNAPPPDYFFSLGFEFDGACLTPDLDGDGFTVCDGDCDETSRAIHPGASEGSTCDLLDNDCDGTRDNLVPTPCAVAGEQGVCADGELGCDATGASFCTPVQTADPAGRDYCGDSLDNDCDGVADPADCDEVPLSEVCTLARDVSAGGTFPSSLIGATDDADAGCGDGFGAPYGNAEVYYQLTLTKPRLVHVEARVPAQVDAYVALSLLRHCQTQGESSYCGGGFLSTTLDAGTYRIAAFGPTPVDFDLRVWMSDPSDPSGSFCTPADLDGDGFTMCTGDCREGEALVSPRGTEVCDGLDNDCNDQVDESHASRPCEAAGLGECAFGELACTAGVESCQATRVPGAYPEVCGDDRDNDCDGLADDTGTPGVDCTEPTGQSCELAAPIKAEGFGTGSLAGAIDHGVACFGGIRGDAPETYHRFEITQPSYVYVAVKPLSGGTAPEFSLGIFGGTCAALTNYGCIGHGPGSFYLSEPGTYYAVVESDQAFAYQLQLAFSDGESCTPFDFDADGTSLCNNDCDDDNPDAYPGNVERCDGLDNDCDAIVDNLKEDHCETSLKGVCAVGRPVCDGEVAVCVPLVAPLANDLCGDTLDNDCDGETDEAGCDALPPGETCGLAEDITGGGAMSGTLSGRSDDGEHCSSTSSVDRFYTFTLNSADYVYLDVRPVGSTASMSVHLFTDCAQRSSFGCGYAQLSGYYLEAGTYTLAVEADAPTDYTLYLAFGSDGRCTALGAPDGDFDADGVSICANDCNEADGKVNPGAPEICGNQRDDNCDGEIDDGSVCGAN